jgi:hypothetical protein
VRVAARSPPHERDGHLLVPFARLLVWNRPSDGVALLALIARNDDLHESMRRTR